MRTATSGTWDVRRVNNITTRLDFNLSWSSHKAFEDRVPAQGNKVNSTTLVSEAKENTA